MIDSQFHSVVLISVVIYHHKLFWMTYFHISFNPQAAKGR